MEHPNQWKPKPVVVEVGSRGLTLLKIAIGSSAVIISTSARADRDCLIQTLKKEFGEEIEPGVSKKRTGCKSHSPSRRRQYPYAKYMCGLSRNKWR